jgi:hypothetical protein
MRPYLLRAILAAAALTPLSALAQMHKVAKPEQVVRAVGVYEWTGDFTKPAASRLIPVTVFIDGQLQDAGVYVARPVPFALLSGNVYELQDAGIDKGMLDLAYARHLQATDAAGDSAYDDGWFGYGSVKPLAVPKKTVAALKPSKTLPVLQSSVKDTKSTTDSTDPDRPTMKRRDNTTTSGTDSTATTQTSTTSTPADDPDRPTMKRRDNTTTTSGTDNTATPASSTQTSNTSTPADDPDRPTMKRRDSTTATSSTDSSNNPAPADDPDRPTLKRHTPEDAKKASANDLGGASGIGSLNDDPNRPNLHRGKPTSSMTEADLPRLTGLPPNLHQMVAVSDAVNRDPHPFALTWDDEAQHAAVLQKMQAMARAQLVAYASTHPTTTSGSSPSPAVKKTATRSNRSTPPPPQPLLDEQLKAYALSYGGAPTYIYSANTGGTGSALRYVTIVAQDDGLGTIKPALQSVTDAAHLDRTPKMQFVDVVDADASNRASLVFELRSQNVRQFALYRVIASHPEQLFLTGTTQ